MTQPSDPQAAPELEGVRALVTGGTSGGLHALRAVTRGDRCAVHIMAADLAGTGIDVNLLLPGGATRTGMRGVKQADAFIVVTPEYNHSIPAALKNAIDSVWLSFGFRNKPVTAQA